MGNEFSRSGQFLSITFDGAADWNSLTETDPAGAFPVGCRVQYVNFKAATAGTGIVIREGSPDGNTEIVRAADMIGQGIAMSLNVIGVCRPCVKSTDVANGDKLNIHFA